MPTSADQHNTLPGRINTFENAAKRHDPPANCILYTDEEREFWNEIVSSKGYKVWTPAMLGLAYKYLRLEFMIRDGYRRLAELTEAGADPFNPDSIAAEYADRIAKFEKHQMTILRSTGLTFTAIQSNDGKANATKDEAEAGFAIASIGKEGGLPSFMARN